MSFGSSNTSLPPISIQEFKLFHNIDRLIFARLVFELCRDTWESVQIVAFWLWLERSGYCRSLNYKILSWPLAVLNQFVIESALCLQSVQTDSFMGYEGIGLIQSMAEYNISLSELHEHRTTVVDAVAKIITEVCLRAFDDIIRRTMGSNVGHVNPSTTPNPNPIPNHSPSFHHQVAGGVPFFPGVGCVPFGNGAIGNVVPVPNPNPNLSTVGFGPFGHGASGNVVPIPNPGPSVGFERHVPNLEPQLTPFERQVLNLDSNDLLNRTSLTVNEEANYNVPQVERTIFLTFSKGYPLSEMEVREFFTRKFGDFIEAIYMQEVEPGEQVLYARLVARSVSIIDQIVQGPGKSKFSINGKHVWARKYVKKNTPRLPNRESNSAVLQSSSSVQMATQEPDYAPWGGYHMWLLMHESDEEN